MKNFFAPEETGKRLQSIAKIIAVITIVTAILGGILVLAGWAENQDSRYYDSAITWNALGTLFAALGAEIFACLLLHGFLKHFVFRIADDNEPLSYIHIPLHQRAIQIEETNAALIKCQEIGAWKSAVIRHDQINHIALQHCTHHFFLVLGNIGTFCAGHQTFVIAAIAGADPPVNYKRTSVCFRTTDFYIMRDIRAISLFSAAKV